MPGKIDENIDSVLDDPTVQMYGVEAAGHGIETGEHAASLDE